MLYPQVTEITRAGSSRREIGAGARALELAVPPTAQRRPGTSS
jgi:hypothetical protein